MRRITIALLTGMIIAAYAIPAVREARVFWFAPDYHPEYYNRPPFPFTGYIYPIILILLFIAAAVPHIIGPALPGFSGAIGAIWSRFTLLLLGVIAILFMIWFAVTPVF
jgi:hypothetical protein